MADIPGARVKMNDVEIAANQPTTESLFVKMGANINAFDDELTSQDTRLDSIESEIGTAVNIVKSGLTSATFNGVTASLVSVAITVQAGSTIELSTEGGEITSLNVATDIQGCGLELRDGATSLIKTAGVLSINYLYTGLSAGTYTINLYKYGTTASNAALNNFKLVAREIRY